MHHSVRADTKVDAIVIKFISTAGRQILIIKVIVRMQGKVR